MNMTTPNHLVHISDWLLRFYAPSWLRAASLATEANFLAEQKPFVDIKDVDYIVNDLRGIAWNIVQDWDRGLLSTGLVCRDVARAAGSVAVWHSGWPEISAIAFSCESDQRTIASFYPAWAALCPLTRHCSWVIGRNASAEIAGRAGINSLIWATAFQAAETALIPVQRITKSAAKPLIDLHASSLNGRHYDAASSLYERSGPDVS